MKCLFLFSVLFSSFFSFSQNLEKDTLQLKEVEVKGDLTKKLKSKKVLFGDKKTRHVLHTLFFNESGNSDILYLIDDIPYGTLQELEFHFSFIRKVFNYEDRKMGTKILETKYDITLYEEDEDGTLKKINSTPFSVILEQGSDWGVKYKVNVSALNVTTNHFYVSLHRTTQLPCDECDFYVPVTFKSEKPLTYKNATPDVISNSQNISITPFTWSAGLFLGIKTLTRDY